MIDPADMMPRVKLFYHPLRTYCLFSGGNDSLVTAHRCREWYDELMFIDTGTAIPGVREFVVEMADWLGKPLRIYESQDAYAKYVRAWGFPGPWNHDVVYQHIKASQIERLVADTKAELGMRPKARGNVMLLTGLRRAESQRRKDRPAVDKRSSSVWVNPLIDWTNEMMREYRAEHDLPQSDVAALLHRSGECNCGAYASKGTREQLQSLWPEWFAEKILPLEDQTRELGKPNCVWGFAVRGAFAKTPSMPESDTPPLCTDCVIR